MEKKVNKGKRVSRRSFLKGAAASTVLAGVGVTMWSGKARPAETLNIMMNGGLRKTDQKTRGRAL